MSKVNRNRSGGQKGERISEDGFTLVETMLVLFFIIVILSVLPPFFLTTTEKMETEQFLYQLQADLYVAQQTAIAKQTAVSFRYYSSLKKYEFRLSGQEVLISRPFSERIHMTGYMTYFFFHPDGNVNKFGNLYIQIDEKKYRLFFSIGKGRFVIDEST